MLGARCMRLFLFTTPFIFSNKSWQVGQTHIQDGLSTMNYHHRPILNLKEWEGGGESTSGRRPFKACTGANLAHTTTLDG